MKITILILLFMLQVALFSKDLKVTFLNPGSAKDIGVWHMVSKFMKAAADDLDIELEVIYADRNHIKMIEQAKELVKRDKKPDYILLVNEKRVGKEMLLILKESQSKIMFIHNGLTKKQRKELGNEREEISNWIGTIMTHEYRAGYKLMSELYKSKERNPKILGINGDKATPVSHVRQKGVTDCITANGHGKHVQIVNGNWSYKDGKEKTMALLKRYKDIDLIWAANDSMALGAFDAVKELKLEKKIFVGGMGGFPDALKSIKNNEMKLTVAGHPMIGAWALVLIHDYHSGVDFKDDIGLNYKIDHLSVINNKEKADLYSKIVLENPSQIDFRKFSRKLNPDLTKYDFCYHKVVKAVKPSKKKIELLDENKD